MDVKTVESLTGIVASVMEKELASAMRRWENGTYSLADAKRDAKYAAETFVKYSGYGGSEITLKIALARLTLISRLNISRLNDAYIESQRHLTIQ